MYDVIIIGAGAAGMMAAGTAAQNGKKVLVIEKMEKAGRKIRITGKGRCNLTNARPPEEFAEQVRTNADFFATAFAEFNNRATIRFFERRGLKLDFERGDRVFPHSGKAWDVANTLEEWCRDNGVEFMVPHARDRADDARRQDLRRTLHEPPRLRTQGRGRTGDRRHGRRLLPRHRLDGRRLHVRQPRRGTYIEPLRPSLTPLVSLHAAVERVATSCCCATCARRSIIDGEPVREEFGEIGFSERGIEGAVALRMSRDAVDALIDGRRVKLVARPETGTHGRNPARTHRATKSPRCNRRGVFRRTAPQVGCPSPW